MAENPPQHGNDDDRTEITPPTWSELLGTEGARERETVPAGHVATSRRELREQEAVRSTGRRLEESASFGFTPDRPPKRRRRWLPWVITPLVALLVIGGGGAAAAFLIVPDWPSRVQELLAGPEELDYTGGGEGEAMVLIRDGDIGQDVAVTLQQAGVTKTFEAFYDLLLQQEGEVTFLPGAYQLKQKMSAQAALDALLDPANRLENEVLVIEGEALPDIQVSLASALQVSVEEVQAASADPASFGLPAEATTLEGFLFPATYQFDPGTAPRDALQQMVNRSFEVLDGLGVAPEQRWTTVVLASIVQRESGPSVEDMAKISRVFLNRIDQGINLQSDATVAYGTGNTHTVWTTDEERANAGNLYNTYANPGLPVGPIGNPGEAALNAAIHPADGDWLFFVPIDLATGETVFSATSDEHEAAVERLQEWCAASDANAAYCE
ncbi:endolytic transglycosylase MltG [Herbiconiux sp. L3-i23]|uniref:endolytic transglycosylase MltG n=1 Tax=Herbiconiux sp. L3-i23 TaxID=2905871 RepID=UPI0020640329|nr:endolytic transglycosylase MltG [Herbiconiux sp. L3-i23]BDI22796.1 hypothetical protein L3i23_15720 [Herbiconiux sp. L3-i23]